MQTIDLQVLSACRDWLAKGSTGWLCTIVAAVGSSPRPVGSLLACNSEGVQVGSLSGGCVEDDLLARIAGGEFSGGPRVIEYGVTAEENERLGLPCGGRLKVLVEPLHDHNGVRDQFNQLVELISDRRCVERQLDTTSGEFTLREVSGFQALVLEGHSLSQCYGPRYRMLLVGAGQLAQSLSELALAMDYEVLVTDPRARVLEQWAGPAVSLLAGMPDDVVRDMNADRHSIVITLTHDPRIDDMALMEALTTDAWYVGALGSARTTEKRLGRLRELELSEAEIARLHAPVGLPIGSKTPVEIAVAIMAELTQLRRTH